MTENQKRKIIRVELLETFAEINDILKADKDAEAVLGNFAKFDELGNPIDSGHNIDSFVLNPDLGYEYKDMGLPSGTLWATKNIGAQSQTDSGLYFSWGSINGELSTSTRQFTGTYIDEGVWEGTYANDAGSLLGDTDNVPIDPTYDAGQANLGGAWRLPTKSEFVELFNPLYTTNEWVTNYEGSGMNGLLVISKANGNTLFFPAAGKFDSSFYGYGSDGRYWSSSCYGSGDTESAYSLYFYSGSVFPDYSNNRCYGYSVRPVISDSEIIIKKDKFNLLDTRLKTIENYFKTEESSDNTINKWNEIVSFLSNIPETTSLQSIILDYTDGVKMKKITQENYNTLVEHDLIDTNTLYIITS